MKPHHILILFLILITLGCSGSTSVPEIYTGTNGLMISFIPETPPSQIFENDRFIVGLKVKNDGPTDIQNGRIAIGIEEDFVEVTGWKHEGNNLGLEQIDYYNYDISLFGKTMESPIAKDGIALVNMQSKKLPGQTEIHTSLITATACYDYKTILNKEVCIESDIFNTGQGVKVCESKEETLSSQGGPVAITKITPTMHPGDDGQTVIPQFRLEVKNLGKGTVISTGAQESCSSSGIDKKKVNQIRINAKLFNRRLSCNPQTFKLDETKTALVSCELSGGVEAVPDAYTSMLIVELEYGYTQTISKEMKIKKEKN